MNRVEGLGRFLGFGVWGIGFRVEGVGFRAALYGWSIFGVAIL